MGRRKFSNGHCDLIPLQIFFILLSVTIKVIQILNTKFQQNIPSRSGENGNFNSFAIFSNGGHLEISTRLNFIILKPWSLIMLHMKFKQVRQKDNNWHCPVSVKLRYCDSDVTVCLLFSIMPIV